MMERFVPRLAWLAAGLVIIGMGYALILGVWNLDPEARIADLLNEIGWGSIPISFAVTAAVILSKQPRNLVGWTLMVPAVTSLADLVSTYLTALDPPPTEASPLMLTALALDNFSWVLLFFPVFFLLLIFPTGKLLSGRWRYLIVLQALMILTMAVASAFSVELGPLEGDWTVTNPIGFLPAEFFSAWFFAIWSTGLIVLALSGIVALFLRFRRGDIAERQQIKWMFLAVIFFALTYSLGAVGTGFEERAWPDLLLGLSINGLPVAIAFGVLRYRLYDIDRFISRSVGYVLVVGLLAAVYISGAVWLPSQLAGNSPIYVAGSTLAVAAAFNPLRRWVQKRVDRRFYRAKYDLDRIAEDFASRLRDGSPASELTDDWMKVVSEALQPSASGVWVRS